MTQTQAYPIGTPGQKWSTDDKLAWLALQSVKRSFDDEVLAKIQALETDFNVEQYGQLNYQKLNIGKAYPLYVIKSHHWDADKATILITGGVHGYETSGVQGAIRFAQQHAHDYLSRFNFIIAPCISPWGYETINRWNPEATDPNRSFYEDSPAQESAALMAYLQQQNISVFAHIDLHETTDTDNSEFRPALAARDAITQTNWNIPDGFYLVGDSENPQQDFQKAMIDSVANITHIAPADDDGKLIGATLSQFGVINYPCKKLGLCAGLSNAHFVTTTEVYPDSPEVDGENCINAQVAAITGGLNYIIQHG